MCSSKFGKEKPGLGRVQFGRIWPFGPGFDSYRRLAINYTVHISQSQLFPQSCLDKPGAYWPAKAAFREKLGLRYMLALWLAGSTCFSTQY